MSEMKSWKHLLLSSLLLALQATISVGMNRSLPSSLRSVGTFSDLSHVPLRLASSVSKTFSDRNGTISSLISSSAESFEYTIDHGNCNKILLVFESLVVNTAEMKISEFNQVGSGSYLFTWSRTQNNYNRAVPPPFFSSTGSIVIYWYGTDDTTFSPSSFNLQYVCSLATWTDSNADFDLQITSGYGTIVPLPIENGNYDFRQSTMMKWHLVPNELSGTMSGPLILSLSHFNIKRDEPSNTGCTGSSCCRGTLTIYDDDSDQGIKLFDDCVNDAPDRWIIIDSQKSLVIFEVHRSIGKLEEDNLVFKLTYFIDNSKYRCGAIGRPDRIDDNTLPISDGSKSTFSMRQIEKCRWLIHPFEANKGVASAQVRLVINRFKFKAGGEIFVFDGETDLDTMLWAGVGPSTAVPPPLLSSSGKLYIVYDSDNRASDMEGFEGSHSSVYLGSKGMGDSSEILAASSVIGLQPPGDFKGKITPDVDYTWFVQPSSNVNNDGITFAFGILNFDCNEGTLTIYDGPSSTHPVLNSYCGTTLPTKWIKSSQNVATITFTTAPTVSSYINGDFSLSYWSDGPNYHCGFQTGPNPAYLTATSMSISDGSSSVEDIYSNEECVWRIEPTDATSITIFFDRFSLRDATLSIFEGTSVTDERNLKITLTESLAIPAPITLSGTSKISILYWSSSSPTGGGFALTYYSSSYNDLGTRFSFPGDNRVNLYSSTCTLVRAPTVGNGKIIQGNYTWVIAPPDVLTGNVLYISMYSLSLNVGQRLEFTSGGSSLDVFTYFDQSAPPKWITTSAGNYVNLELMSELDISGDFELAYYSDGTSIHCGLTVMDGDKYTGTIKSPSMIISDGSSAIDYMNPNEKCRWTIDPAVRDAAIIFEFIRNDLRGANMIIYDGTSSDDPVLWSCNGCQIVPGPIVGTSGSLYIEYDSTSGGTMGRGFVAFYWMLRSISTWSNRMNGTLLVNPENVEINSNLDDNTTSWTLEAFDDLAELSFSPRIIVENTKSNADLEAASFVIDGRNPDDVDYQSASYLNFVCGSVVTETSHQQRTAAQLRASSDDRYSYTASQYSASFVSSKIEDKKLSNIYFQYEDTSYAPLRDPQIAAAATCKYDLTSGSTQAISIKISEFRSNGAANLFLYGGITGRDRLLKEALAKDIYNQEFVAPCGLATLIMELNSTETVEHVLKMSYKSIADDVSSFCDAYKRSLLPVKKEYDPTMDILIVFGTFVFLFLFVVCVVFYQRNKHLFKKKRIVKIISPYPKYTPKLDEFRNKFLSKGKCCICQDSNVKVFKLKCQHCICVDDLKGYLEAALGDISMFPVKCPMHYDGCPGYLLASTAKRVLSRSQFERFIEFSDRAQYGEGMRCIFCNNFVNFPPDNSASMVSCPFCLQRFCLRCKKPWHFAGKCPLESVNDDLQQWQASSGAQKCPVCSKLIEKDDPETCHHMIHKITDGIPCIRDRTDFCYLCGVEVTPDYPHEEVENPGVNHFPDGVFQQCRAMKQKQKDAERDKLRRARRQRKPTRSSNANNDKIVALYSDDWEM